MSEWTWNRAALPPIKRVPVAVLWVGGLVLLAAATFALALQMFAGWRLADFTVTFYPAANYLLRGQNVYVNSYPHPFNGREYPPYSPIWALFTIVPLATRPPQWAEAARFLLDVAGFPFLAWLAARWAGAKGLWAPVLLVIAPWHITELSGGQFTPLVLLGTLLAYSAVRRRDPGMLAVALWLMLSKFTLVSLVVLASVLFAFRFRILFKTLVTLISLIALTFLAQPSWPVDLFRLYVDRLAHPRMADSILLLPGYPWGQLALLGTGALLLVFNFWRFHPESPPQWLWGVLVAASLVGAVHTFIYDWMLLMLPMALIVRERWGALLGIAAYGYAILWSILSLGFSIPFPTPAIIPSLVLVAVLGFARPGFGLRALINIDPLGRN